MPKRTPPVSDDDRDLFRNTMRGVKPIKSKTTQRKPPPAKLPRKPFSQRHEPIQQTTAPYYATELRDNMEAADVLHFARNGLQQRLLQRFKRGNMPIEASLDLHRLTVTQALNATDQFLAQCQQRHLRVVLIIHGKGGYSKDAKPALKNALNTWLKEQTSVLGFHSAQPRHGGTGAVYVLLKLPTGSHT